ncbi:phosphonate ABC transporter, permease protein PhnE [bacterium]|nr:phosphonate ABC transporter, permease protein PhnE [bacterium]
MSREGASAADIARAAEAAPQGLDPPLSRRMIVAVGWVLGLAIFVLLLRDLGLSFDQFGRGVEKLGRFFSAMWPPSDGGQLPRILRSLAETFAMAFLGTFLGAVAAVPLGLLGAKTIVGQAVIHFLLRRSFDVFRGIPALVWALILISALGLGPLAGILALALEDAPRMAKLFAETIENADERQKEGVRSTGASSLAVLRFGLAPQVAPVWASQMLYFLERNFRSAAVLGIVGAGGIGFELEERIRIFAFDEVIFIVLIYMVCVAMLDFGSQRLRMRLGSA